MSTRDGMNYAPTSAATPRAVEPGAFVFAASHLDHGHIYGQCNGLTEAGGVLKAVFDPHPDPTRPTRSARARKLADTFAEKTGRPVEVVDDFRRILDDPEIRLVASAAVPSERCAVGLQVLDAGKDYFTDKSPFTTLGQLALARAKVEETGRKWMVYYSERLHVESAWHAGELIRQNAVGRVLQVALFAPHNLAKPTRPAWFFDKAKYGGILTDIGSHQFEQFLAFTGSSDATINFARVENFANPDTPGLEDFGEASLTTDTGASCYCRIDWFNPGGSKVWGDGRLFILGTDGSIEIRKYVDLARGPGDKLFLVDRHDTHEIDCRGKVGFPFFGRLILDCLNRTEHAMTQAHAFKAAELAMQAQAFADARRSEMGKSQMAK